MVGHNHGQHDNRKGQSTIWCSGIRVERKMIFQETRTNESDDLDFLAVLVLVSTSNPRSIAAGVWGASDAREHEPTGHGK